MKNKLTLIIFFLLETGSLLAEEPLTKQRLETGSWLIQQGNGGGQLIFKAGTFTLFYADEGIPKAEASGTYEISGNSVFFNPLQIKTSGHLVENSPADIKHIKDVELASPCKFDSPGDAVEFSDGLFCPFYIFWDNRATLSPGTLRKINGVAAIATGRQVVGIKAPVFVRELPSLSANPLQCDWGLDGTKIGLLNPKSKIYPNYTVSILARTIEKSSIKAWTSYWYLVEIRTEMLGGCMISKGWVFGEFIIGAK